MLDSSAVLALLRGETGATRVQSVLKIATISAVNIQEVYKKLLEHGAETAEAVALLDTLNLEIVDHDADAALAAAALYRATRSFGSGLGDRTCLSLAITTGATAMTADKAWTRLDIPGLTVELIR